VLWKAAAEAEYLAFQISFQHGLIDYESSKGAECGSDQDPLDQARALLAQARELIQTDPRGAYEGVRGVVTILRSAYVEEERASRLGSGGST
jgi:hypothetical protein